MLDFEVRKCGEIVFGMHEENETVLIKDSPAVLEEVATSLQNGLRFLTEWSKK